MLKIIRSIFTMAKKGSKSPSSPKRSSTTWADVGQSFVNGLFGVFKLVIAYWVIILIVFVVITIVIVVVFVVEANKMDNNFNKSMPDPQPDPQPAPFPPANPTPTPTIS